MYRTINDDLLDKKLAGLHYVARVYGIRAHQSRDYIRNTEFELGDLGYEFVDMALTYLALKELAERYQRPASGREWFA